MKLSVLLGLSATAFAASCGSIGDSGGSRAKAFFCPGKLVLDEKRLTAECPEAKCSSAFCCVSPVVTDIVIEEAAPSEVVVVEPLLMPGTCGSVVSGSRPSRHVCGSPHVFDISKVNAVCGARGCDDETCCRAEDPLHDCSTNPDAFTAEKARFCCIEEGIACKPQVCAAGAGILSDDETVCCHVSCGSCGGKGCFGRPGGSACCKTLIREMRRPCGFYSAPCSNVAPVPQPFPFPVPQPLPLPMPVVVPVAPIYNPVVAPVVAPVFNPTVGLYPMAFPPLYTKPNVRSVVTPFRTASPRACVVRRQFRGQPFVGPAITPFVTPRMYDQFATTLPIYC